MGKLDFNSFASKVRSTDPYRGSMRYPMDNRSNRANSFELVENGDDIEFHVCHNYQYEQIPISEARYELLKDVRGARVHKKTSDYEKHEYYTYKVKPQTLCIVRSDNSLEYVGRFGQGDNMKMSDWSRGYQYDSYLMSGTAYTQHNDNGKRFNHPVFTGLRVNQETREPVGMDVRVFQRKVNRKRAKDLMAKYKEAFKSPDALFRCMDVETMIVSVKDILSEHYGEDNYVSSKDAFTIAEKLFTDGNNFEAVVMYGVAQGIGGFNRWALENYNAGRSYYRMTEPKNVVPRILATMSRNLYKEHKPFDEEEVDFRHVAGGRWGVRVEVNGVEVNR